jgi:uncharacterized membrane protein
LILTAILTVGAAIRFMNLDNNFLWSDEVSTTVYSLGRSFREVPLETLVSISQLDPIFVLNRDATCGDISRSIVSGDTHPPGFFCLMHSWLKLVGFSVWAMRAVPAVFGILAVVALYWLTRTGFSRLVGLMAAAMASVSPFAMHLSQEARHYTLPMVLLTLALVGLVFVRKDILAQHRVRWPIAGGWIVVNCIGLYVHYFFIVSFIAQVATLTVLMWLERRTVPRRCWIAVAFATAAVALCFLPWLPTALEQMTRPETNWLNVSYTRYLDILSPPILFLGAMLTMVMILPVETYPLRIVAPSALLMLLFGVWLVRHLYRGWRQLWQDPNTRQMTLLLSVFVLCVLLEFLASAYILRKNVFLFFRYNAFYSPAVGALAAACLMVLKPAGSSRDNSRWRGFFRSLSPQQIRVAVLVAGIISCAFVVTDLAFKKPFYHPEVAASLAMNRSSLALMVVGYETEGSDVALGLAYVPEVRKRQAERNGDGEAAEIYFAFLKRSQGDDHVRQKILEFRQSLGHPLDLWMVNWPGKSADLTGPGCAADPPLRAWGWVPFQLFRCP